MEKFLNLMYDFFAFSLPGSVIIIAWFLPFDLCQGLGVYITWLSMQSFALLILIAITGYLVGYIITPIAKRILLLFFTYKVAICLKKKMKCKNILANHKIYNDLKRNNKSKEFTLIREYTPRNAQYIEFWSMHITMAHNLAFAVIFIYPMLICKSGLSLNDARLWCFTVVSLLIVIVLLCISHKFSKWWYYDIQEAKKHADFEKHMNNQIRVGRF